MPGKPRNWLVPRAQVDVSGPRRPRRQRQQPPADVRTRNRAALEDALRRRRARQEKENDAR